MRPERAIPARYCLWITFLLLGVARFTWAQTNALPDFKVETAREYLRSLGPVIASQLGTNAESLYSQARLNSHLGEKDEAERLARLALEMQTNRSDIAVFLAEILVRKDRMDEAAAVLEKAVQASPGVKGGQRQLGMVLDRLGKPEQAEAAFRAAVSVNPRDATARLLLGRFLLDHGNINEAVTNLQKACQLDPESANAYYPLAQALSRQGDKIAAEKASARFKELKQVEKEGMGKPADGGNNENAATLRSHTAEVHTELAGILLRQSQGPLAETHLCRAIEIAPEEPAAHELLGNYYLQRGRLPEARAELELFTRLRPKQLAAQVNLGTVLLQLKDYPAAVAQLKHTLELDPNEPMALQNLARYYLGSRTELPAALELCQRTVANNPTGANYDLLAWALYANQRTNDALKAISQAIEKDPANPTYRQKQERLRQAAGITK